MAKHYTDRETGHRGIIDEKPGAVRIECTECNIATTTNVLRGAKSQFSKKHKERTTYP